MRHYLSSFFLCSDKIRPQKQSGEKKDGFIVPGFTPPWRGSQVAGVGSSWVSWQPQSIRREQCKLVLSLLPPFCIIQDSSSGNHSHRLRRVLTPHRNLFKVIHRPAHRPFTQGHSRCHSEINLHRQEILSFQPCIIQHFLGAIRLFFLPRKERIVECQALRGHLDF